MEHDTAAYAVDALRSAGLIPTVIAVTLMIVALLLIHWQFDS